MKIYHDGKIYNTWKMKRIYSDYYSTYYFYKEKFYRVFFNTKEIELASASYIEKILLNKQKFRTYEKLFGKIPRA